jgi:hypothetical protein
MADRELFSWTTFRGLGPVLAFIVGFETFMCGGVAIVWSLAGHITQNQTNMADQGAEINLLLKSANDRRTLLDSISMQIAQLAQSVAEIKAQETHALK